MNHQWQNSVFYAKYDMQESNNLLLRTLTLKSKIGFGTYKDCTVNELFIMGKENVLVEIYFNLSKINYNTEILDKLNMPDDLRIAKPSKCPENRGLYWKYIETIRLNSMSADEYKKKAMEAGAKKYGKKVGRERRVTHIIDVLYSKGALQKRNHKK